MLPAESASVCDGNEATKVGSDSLTSLTTPRTRSEVEKGRKEEQVSKQASKQTNRQSKQNWGDLVMSEYISPTWSESPPPWPPARSACSPHRRRPRNWSTHEMFTRSARRCSLYQDSIGQVWTHKFSFLVHLWKVDDDISVHLEVVVLWPVGQHALYLLAEHFSAQLL